MKSFRPQPFIILIAIVACLAAMTTTAEASSPCMNSFASPGWLGYYGSPYSLGQIPVPPYYALHPPVYYSHPVARSYGYSPYPYSGDTKTPNAEKMAIIENPYVEPTPVVQNTLKTAAVKVINNPFVQTELATKFATIQSEN